MTDELPQRDPIWPTDDELMSEDRPFETRQARRGGWARVEVGRDVYFGFVRAVEVFGVTRCEILLPHADNKPGVRARKSYRGRDVFTIEGVSKARCIEEVSGDDEGAP